MNRLYRGKRIDNGEMAEGYYWCNGESDKHYIRRINFQPAETDYTDFQVHPDTVGQSTGLKDVSGVDLDWWEGDLLKGLNFTYKIIFDLGCFWLVSVGTVRIQREPLYAVYKWSEMPVKVGTIHTPKKENRNETV